jgi:hypothetical protein
MPILWIATCEVSVPPGDIKSGRTLAYTNFVTWGEDADDALAKIRDCCEEYEWHLLGSENIHPVEDGKDYGESLNDVIDRAEGNPKAVIFGTFFTYPAQ